jgi:hypothetical protein
MSTKTLRKRIALVAVSALGAGLLSVVPVTSANAAVVNGSENSAVGTAGPASAENVLNIASINSLTGSATVSATVGDNRSLGLVNISDIAGTRISGTTATAVLLSNGALTVYTTTSGTNTNDANFAAITVEGGTIGTAVAADGSNLLVFYPSNNPNVEKGIDLANSSLKEPWNGNWSCKGNGSTLAINLLPSECR